MRVLFRAAAGAAVLGGLSIGQSPADTLFAWQQPDLTRVTTNHPRTIGLEYQTKF
jgi:hypothetical protein